MDSLLRVMAAKKRELSVVRAEKEAKKEKYLRRSEVEDLLYAQEKQQAMQASSKKRRLETTSDKDAPRAAETATLAEEEEETPVLSWVEMKRRLRDLGEPITLYGETEKQRMARLRNAEHAAATRREDELGDGHATRNEFLDGDDAVRDRADAMYDDEGDEKQDTTAEGAGGGAGGDASADDTGDDEKDDVMVVYSFFKGMLRRWEQDLADRPDHIKRMAQGKIATKTMKQCKDYIRPLFKLCKKREVSSDILPSLVQIVKFCKDGEFVQANDAYIKLAIGNAAWPIGVTMVGIHERTGREKINANKQAHVMNNEAQRKYITSVKRLISYAQSVANVLPSKKVN